MGQGLRRRPRHPDRAGPRGAAAGPAARAGRRLPGRRARGRDGRRVRLLPARQGRRRPVDRHRDARAGRRRARRPPAPRLRDRAGDRGRRGGADRGVLRRPGGVGAVAAPRLPARPGHRRDQGGQPAGHRLHPRRARHHRLGRHQRGGRGEFAGDHPHRGAVPRRQRQPPNRSARWCPATRRCRRRSGARRPRRSPRRSAASRRRTGRRSATSPTPTWCWSSCPGRSSPRWPSWARPARTISCAPRSSRWSSTCPRTASVEEILARLPELHEAYRADYQGYYDRNATPDSPAIRGADPAIVLVPGRGDVLLRQGQADRPGRRRVLRQRDQRDARRRIGVHLRPDQRGGEVRHRVLGAGGGEAAADAEAQGRWPPGSRWSPAPAPGSARPSPPGSPPRAAASSSPT